MLTPYKLFQKRSKHKRNMLTQRRPFSEAITRNKSLDDQQSKSHRCNGNSQQAKNNPKYEIVMRESIRRVSTYRMNRKKSINELMDGEENRDLLIQSYKTQSDNVFDGEIDKQAWKSNLEGLEGKQMAMNQNIRANKQNRTYSPQVKSRENTSATGHYSSQKKDKLIILQSYSTGKCKKAPAKQPSKCIKNSVMVLEINRNGTGQNDQNFANFIRTKKKSKLSNTLRQLEKDGIFGVNGIETRNKNLGVAILDPTRSNFKQYKQLQASSKHLCHPKEPPKPKKNTYKPRYINNNSYCESNKKKQGIFGWQTQPSGVEPQFLAQSQLLILDEDN